VKKKILYIYLLTLIATSASAVSAFPWPIEFIQPNGSKITVVQRGDERLHWFETTDGITLLQNEAGYLTYARLDSAGNMIPSDVIAQNEADRPAKVKASLALQIQKVFFSQAQISAARQKAAATNSAQKVAAPTGTNKILVILMGFRDVPFTFSNSAFSSLFNQTGYSVNNNNGSVADYFKANSYGKLSMNFDVYGPYVSKNNRAYYGKDTTIVVRTDLRPDSLIEEAIRNVYNANSGSGTTFDFSQYKAIHVIFAGNGQEYTGVTSDAIWSHQGSFTPPSYCPITAYSCTPEFYGNTSTYITSIGVLCHELTHVIGAPDFYDVDYDYTGNGEYIGTGEWDLMAEGNWNYLRGNLAGTCPANINMFQKIQFGWVTPAQLTTPQTINNMPNSAQNATAYVYSTPTRGEHYVLENRQQIGYDAAIPGHGLLIYHVMADASDELSYINSTYPLQMYPVCASSTVAVPSKAADSYGDINSSGCPFPGSANNNSFTDNSTPSAKTLNGVSCNKPLTGITESNQTISFSFMDGVTVAPAPLNLAGTLSSNQYQLTWNAPSNIPMLADTIVQQHWDGPALGGALMTGTPETLACLQAFSPASLTTYVGKTWTGVRFYPVDSTATNYSVQIYDLSSTKTVLTSQKVSSVKPNAWNDVLLTSPVNIGAGKVYGVAVTYTSQQGFTLSVDRGPKVESNNNYGTLIIEGNTIYTLGSSIDYNFSVRGLINLGSAVSYNIYYNGTKIGSSPTPGYTISSPASGTYCVKTVNNGTEGEGTCIDYTAPANLTLSIYTVGKRVYIDNSKSGDIIRIYSMTGQLIKNDLSQGVQTSFDLPTGIWIVKAGAKVQQIIIL
jgi:M6 family metalloprotease-like protein